MKSKYNNTVMNTVMLYLMNIAKMVFPLITLPYLTRVLSVDCYGVVAYVKVMVGYAQIIIDFGFILSAVKEIVEANNDKGKISQIIGDTVISKLMLSAVAVGGIIFICSNVEILEGNMTFTCLSLCVPVLSCFLMDFLFRGIEKMHIITIIYVFMKTVSTLFTLFAVKGDGDILLIPLFDMLSSVLAIILTWIIVKHLGFSLRFTSFRNCINKIKASFGYFANSMASSAFGALNTVIMGIFMKDTQQIAFWSVCMQVVGAIQNMYTPISNGIYPYMIKTKEFKFIKRILMIFTPMICLGTVICYIFAPFILNIIAGSKYMAAADVFRWLSPVIIMSFPVAILGWPALGAIGKVKETTKSTLWGALVQILGLLLFAVTNQFTIINIAMLRNLSEFAMLFTRGMYLYRYRDCFNKHREGDI